MQLRKLMLTQRFALMIACVFTGFLVYGFWSFRTLDQLKVNGPLYEQIIQGKDIVADVLPPPEYIIESYLVALQLVTEEEREHDHLIERFRALNKEYLERHRFWLQQSLPSELRTALLETSFDPATRFYELGFNTLIPALKTGQRDSALAALSTMKLAYEEHRRAIDNVVRQANARVADDETRAREAIGSAMTILLSVLVISACLTVFLAFLLTQSITSPLFAMRNKLGIVNANKDFRVRLDASFDDEVGQMAAMVNDIIAELQAILLQISGNAATLSDTAITLSASSTQILSSSGDQNDAATSMVGEITQLNTSIQNLSDNARRALSLSQESGRLSNSGGDIIENAANTMLMIAQTVQQTSGSLEALGNQSQQISSVVKVIQDVADQTNLLALNAAIEAARAGEQGRGFAVVADEVRNLAKRTTRATEEISQMIDAMQASARVAIEEIAAAVDKANGGAVIAQKAGEAINQIKAGSATVVNVVNDISKSLDLQAQTTDAIHDHVSRVARMAAENATAIERTAGSAVELANLSAQMKQTVSTFNL